MILIVRKKNKLWNVLNTNFYIAWYCVVAIATINNTPKWDSNLMIPFHYPDLS